MSHSPLPQKVKKVSDGNYSQIVEELLAENACSFFILSRNVYEALQINADKYMDKKVYVDDDWFDDFIGVGNE